MWLRELLEFLRRLLNPPKSYSLSFAPGKLMSDGVNIFMRLTGGGDVDTRLMFDGGVLSASGQAITLTAADAVTLPVTARAMTMTPQSIALAATAFTAPMITSNGAGATASISVQENQTAVTTVTATGNPAPTFSLVGGSDQARFSINSSTGVLVFSSVPDYEAPTDSNADNVYQVVVQASSSFGSDTQTISVTVTDVSEGGVTNPGQGLISDKVNRPKTAVTKPALLGTWVDPQFGTTIRRITNVTSQWSGSTVAKPAYATVPAWNADESLMILYVTNSTKGHMLLHGKTYAPIKFISWSLTDLEHFMWSASDPDTCYYITAQEQSGTSIRRLMKYHPSNDSHEIIYNIPNASSPGAYRVDFGGDPIYCSWDNDVFGLRRRGSSDTGFTYRISTNTESVRIAGDAPQIAPSGTICIAANTTVADIPLTTAIRTLTVDGVEHGSMARLANGQDIWATVQFDDIEGTLVTENLTTGQVKVLVGPSTGFPYPPTGTHISGHAFQAPGWVAVSATGNTGGSTLLAQEVLLVNLNDDKIYRAGRHRSYGGDGSQGYWAEPHINISPTATRLLFGSDWDNGGTVDSYVIELPAYSG